jgi:energy-coupling factor transporter ATP-binding protein EcfA2
MKLSTFQIINCFGFRDSGEVNLYNPNNLIYLLGRNSSGKSSLLNSIKYFEIDIIPSEMPKFRNFNKSQTNPLFKVKFLLENTKLSFPTFVKHITTELGKSNITEEAITYNDKIKTFVEEAKSIYKNLIEEVNNEEKVEIQKLSDGSYHFIQAEFNKYKTRKAKIEQLIKNAKDADGHFRVHNHAYQISLTFNIFEKTLFLQFPKIYIFNEQYSLNNSLPDKIITDWEDNNDKFEKRFIQYLGEDSVDRFLAADDPEERERIINQLTKNLKKLVKKVNENRSTTEKTDLLEMRLDSSKEGIQITVKTDGKKSFYSHLSDNTKFLFAYHLYAETDNIQKNILLFDEPNNGFHPTAQKKMLRFLQDLGKKGNQVIVSTHSEYLIDPDYLSSVRLMSSDEKKNIIVKNRFYNQTKEKGDFLALQPIFDAIGYKYGNQLEIENKVIITEGVTDLLYLRAFNKILKFNLDLHIAPARGEAQIPHLISFLISQGISFKILIDTGIMKSHIQTAFGVEDKFIHEIPIPSLFARKVDGSGIEDLFSKTDFEKILNRVGCSVSRQFPHKSNSKYMKSSEVGTSDKRLIAHFLLENVNSFKKTDFEKETNNNFNNVLEFCKKSDWFGI